MTKWKTKTIPHESLERELNELSSEGWEVYKIDQIWYVPESKQYPPEARMPIMAPSPVLGWHVIAKMKEVCQ